MSKAKYVVMSRIEGATKEPLKEGDLVDLSDDVAGPLLSGGALAFAKEQSKEPPKGGEKDGDKDKK